MQLVSKGPKRMSTMQYAYILYPYKSLKDKCDCQDLNNVRHSDYGMIIDSSVLVCSLNGYIALTISRD